MEEREMRSDVELLLDLCDEAPVVRDRVSGHFVTFSRKQIAHWTGFAVQTISDYCKGKYNVPIEFWRRILDHVYEPRIVGLLLGDSSRWEVCIDSGPEPETTSDFFRAAIEESGAHHQMQMYIAEMLRDNRIDELDASTIQRFNDTYTRHRHLDAQLSRAINRAYQSAIRDPQSAIGGVAP